MRRLLFLVPLCCCLLAACDDTPSVGPEEPGPTTLDPNTSTWGYIQTQIFAPKCAEACHTEGTSFATQSKLLMTNEVSYDQLVGVPPENAAARADGLLRVSDAGPSGLERSFLWKKINAPEAGHFYDDHPEYGALMPLGAPVLTYGELEYIKQWILSGAPESGEAANRASLTDTVRYRGNDFEPLSPPAQGLHLRVGPFDVSPSYERELFYYEDLSHTEDLFIERVEMRMRAGSHHFILYQFPDAGQMPPNTMPAPQTYRDLRDAQGNYVFSTQALMLYHIFFAGTQWPRMNYAFPPGVALRLPAEKGLDLNSHYVNHGDAPYDGEVHINLHTVPEGSVTHVADVLQLNNLNLNLPPRQVTTVERTFTMPEKRHVFQLFSHAHQRMTAFRVEVVGGPRHGEEVYYTTSWDHPPILEIDPPLVLEAGQGLKLITTYNNDTDRTLRFGFLSEDEMMILFGYYY